MVLHNAECRRTEINLEKGLDSYEQNGYCWRRGLAWRVKAGTVAPEIFPLKCVHISLV